jgi:hypothetical protein
VSHVRVFHTHTCIHKNIDRNKAENVQPRDKWDINSLAEQGIEIMPLKMEQVKVYQSHMGKEDLVGKFTTQRHKECKFLPGI